MAVMPEHDGLMRIFWPRDIPKSEFPGVVVGWRNFGLDVFVVAVLDHVEVGDAVVRGSRPLLTSNRLGMSNGH